MEEIFLAQPVVTQVVAVIAGEDDERVIHSPAFFKICPQPPQMIVKLLDKSHVGGDDGLADFFLGKTLAACFLQKGIIDRMWVNQFILVADNGHNILCTIQIMIGGGAM